MISIIEILVAAALHLVLVEGASCGGVAGSHMRVEAAAQTPDDLGLVENALDRYTGRRRKKKDNSLL